MTDRKQQGRIGRIEGPLENKQCYKGGGWHMPSQVVAIGNKNSEKPTLYICRGCLAKLGGQDLGIQYRKG